MTINNIKNILVAVFVIGVIYYIMTPDNQGVSTTVITFDPVVKDSSGYGDENKRMINDNVGVTVEDLPTANSESVVIDRDIVVETIENITDDSTFINNRITADMSRSLVEKSVFKGKVWRYIHPITGKVYIITVKDVFKDNRNTPNSFFCKVSIDQDYFFANFIKDKDITRFSAKVNREWWFLDFNQDDPTLIAGGRKTNNL